MRSRRRGGAMQLCFNAGTTLCHAPQSVMEGCPLPTSCKEGWHAGAGPGTEKGGLSAQFSLPFTTGQNYHLQVTLFGLFVATQRARSPFPGCSILCQSEREGRTQPTGLRQRIESRDGRRGAFTLTSCCHCWCSLISDSFLPDG